MAFPEIEFSSAKREDGWVVTGLTLKNDTPANRTAATSGCAKCCYQSQWYKVLTNRDNRALMVAACTGFEEGTASGNHGTVNFFEAGLSVRTPKDEEFQLPISRKAPPCGISFSFDGANK